MNGPDNLPARNLLRTRRERRAYYRYAERAVNGLEHNGQVARHGLPSWQLSCRTGLPLCRAARRGGRSLRIATHVAWTRRLHSAWLRTRTSPPPAVMCSVRGPPRWQRVARV